MSTEIGNPLCFCIFFIKVSSLSISHASLLSWSLAPELSRPDVYATSNRIPSLKNELDLIMQREEYGTDINKLVNAIAPNCTEFILECSVGTTIFTGKECCGTVFSATPVFTRYGTCFTTKTANLQHKVNLAGEGSGLTVVTMHDGTNPFDRKFARYVLSTNSNCLGHAFSPSLLSKSSQNCQKKAIVDFQANYYMDLPT